MHLTPNFFSAEMKLYNIHIKNLIILSVSGIFKGFGIDRKLLKFAINWFTTELAGAWLYSWFDVTDSFTWHKLFLNMHAKSFWHQIGNRPMPLSSSVVRQSVSNFRLYCCSKKFHMLRKNVKSLLEQLQVCIFAEIVFGVRCTLTNIKMERKRWPKKLFIWRGLEPSVLPW